MTPYRPPRQSMRGQLLDAVVILALLFGTLFVTTYVAASQGGGGGAAEDSEPRPLAELPITDAERQRFGTLIDNGTMDLAAVNAAVEANQASADRYSINFLALAATVIVIVGYLAFVYRVSFKEYKEVIEEKFGPSGGDSV